MNVLNKIARKVFRFLLKKKVLQIISDTIQDVHFDELKCQFQSIGVAPNIRFPWNCVTGLDSVSIGDSFHANSGLFLGTYGEKQEEPKISIGNNVIVNYDCQITAIRKIVIGNDVLIGSRVLITDHGHGSTTAREMDQAPVQRTLVSKGPVIIGHRVWIGSGVVILPGVTIGEGCIIGANSVVTKSFPERTVVGGVPAKAIRKLD